MRASAVLQETALRTLSGWVFAPVAHHLPVLQIRAGNFYQQPLASNGPATPLFQGLDLTIGHPAQERWAVVGPAGAGKTTFLELLRGRHQSDPADARQYPALTALATLRGTPDIEPTSLIKYVGPVGREGKLASATAQGAYLSARYESHSEAGDLTLGDYLTGNTQLNPDPQEQERIVAAGKGKFYNTLLRKLNLTALEDQRLSNLSNGQTRRARLAESLMSRPGMLLLDEPFIGLDPVTTVALARQCYSLSTRAYLSMVFAFDEDSAIPQDIRITHIAYLNAMHEIEAIGTREEVSQKLRKVGKRLSFVSKPVSKTWKKDLEVLKQSKVPQDTKSTTIKSGLVHPTFTPFWYRHYDAPAFIAERVGSKEAPPAVIDMSGVQVNYGSKTALGAWQQEVDGEMRPGLWWKVKQGERWGLFGANGAGKTTLLSLISSDHPRAYSEPIKVFGRSRLPTAGKPGLALFDLQARIGHASPEIHNFFPRSLTIRQTLESAWADTFRSRPRLTHPDDKVVEATLRWFRPLIDPSHSASEAVLPESITTLANLENYLNTDVDWADHLCFGELSFSSQRVVLFLRAVIRKSELVILDEAFGGMTEEAKIRCMLWLSYGEHITAYRHQKRTRYGDLYGKKRVCLGTPARTDMLVVGGFEPRQTLLCVAHRRDDVPPLLSHWMVLPPDGGRTMENKTSLKADILTGENDDIQKNPPHDNDGSTRSEMHVSGGTGVAPRFGRFFFGETGTPPTALHWQRGRWWEDMWFN